MAVTPDYKMTTADLERMWIEDFPMYAKDQLFIQPMPDAAANTTGGTQLKNLELNDPQVVLDQVINEIKAEGRLMRLIVLKARREGVSTYISGRDYWMTTTRFNRYSLLVTHEPEATEFLFQMHKRFYQHNPIWKPTITYNNKRLLNFDTRDGKGLGSAIRVATAGKEDIGSGQAIHYLHLSEMAKWPAHTVEAIMTSVLQCVPKSPDTEVVIESTAKGIGGEFYNRYWGARYMYDITLKDGKPHINRTINEKSDPSNEFSSIFLPWFIFESYKMPVPEGFESTKEEKEMMETYGITEEHLVWRRWCIANNCNGHESIFQQEYPANAEEAFISSGQPVFDIQQLIKLRDAAPKPKACYDISIDTGVFFAQKDGPFKVWEEPQPGETYVVPADVAEGIDRNVMGRVADYSALGVFKCSTGEQVAEWHGKCDPDHFAHLMSHIGKRYNTAWAVPERNNHGNSTVFTLSNVIKYPRIYVERVPEAPNKIRKRFGWLTTRPNKKDIVNNLLAEMRDGTHGLKSRELFVEMMSFKQEGEKYGADAGKFDDRVMYAMIGKYTLPTLKPVFGTDPSDPVSADRNRAPSEPPVGAWII